MEVGSFILLLLLFFKGKFVANIDGMYLWEHANMNLVRQLLTSPFPKLIKAIGDRLFETRKKY